MTVDENRAFFMALRGEEMVIECDPCHGIGMIKNNYCVTCLGRGEVDMRERAHPADAWTIPSLRASEPVSNV